MERQIRRYGPVLVILALLVGLAAVLVPAPRRASATSFVDPWWSNGTPSPACGSCGCGCPRPAEWANMSENDGWGGLDVGVNTSVHQVRLLRPVSGGLSRAAAHSSENAPPTRETWSVERAANPCCCPAWGEL